MNKKVITFVSMALLLTGVPAYASTNPPSNVVATSEGTSITLNFGGIPGDNYIALCREYVNGVKASLSPITASTTSPITIKNLKAKSNYLCYVANNVTSKNWDKITPSEAEMTGFNWIASNQSGYITTKEIVIAPTNVRTVAGAGSIVVFFDYPKGASTATAVCTSKNGGAQLSQSNDASPIVLLNANPGNTYNCTLTTLSTSGVTSPSVTGNDVTVPVAGSGVPTSPAIDKVNLIGSQLVITSLPSLNGSAITTFNATCVNTSSKKIFTSSANTFKVTVPVDAIGSYSCTLSGSNSYGKSQESSAVVSTQVNPGSVRGLTHKVGTLNSSGANVVFTTPLDSGAVSVKISCIGTSSQNFGREYWTSAFSTNGKNPTGQIALTYGNWSCSYQNTSSAGLSPESNKIVVKIQLPAPTIKISKGKAIVYKPTSWTGAWAAICISSDSTQVIKGSSSSSVSMSLAKGKWLCSASLNSVLTQSKSITI